jgi:putative oxidoreductase
MIKISSFAGSPYWRHNGMAVVRIILGLLLIYHGQEIFKASLMQEYATWDTFKGPGGMVKIYVGKFIELIAGISLLLGLFTRLGALLTIMTFLYITFFVGGGRFWYEDQHPFMYVLLGLVYFFNGPGNWSLDQLLFKSNPSGSSWE